MIIRLLFLVNLIILVITLMAIATKWKPIEDINDPVVGGWSPIKGINDPHVTDIANFAVSKFNNQTGATLKFEKVIKGESQVVAGINYHLIISTSNSVHNFYNARVYDRPWEHVRKLTTFMPVIDH
ncbi:cysteine proteinase inhibitor 5-like [Trifolium medium]|uniref:Cysteine proteinase inhibitor 5-like n=1 Tax=Trifolium medium TaxID=97028 RepID=A0A392QPU8_9FABA|nr:cysteine proteinase inhibitor 5-like [Trifolium medium]